MADGERALLSASEMAARLQLTEGQLRRRWRRGLVPKPEKEPGSRATSWWRRRVVEQWEELVAQGMDPRAAVRRVQPYNDLAQEPAD